MNYLKYIINAILCAADQIDGSFAVINEDDYYGKDGFM